MKNTAPDWVRSHILKCNHLGGDHGVVIDVTLSSGFDPRSHLQQVIFCAILSRILTKVAIHSFVIR